MQALGLLALLAAAAQGAPPSPAPEEEKEPAFREVVVVTAAGQPQKVGDSASLVSVVAPADLAVQPALVLDDHLRRIPGFSLFRRSSSMVANPTTHGVSLRGIGPSGASRSLVLFDGIPVNDPFGGWVSWSRLPVSALGPVEVVRGATSQLYGSAAMGGTIQILAREPGARTLDLRAQAGSRGTWDLDAFASDRKGDWRYLLSGRVFQTDGFFIVAERDRGAADARAASESQALFGRVFYKSAHASANLFHDQRANGTVLQENSSRLALFDAGITRPSWRWNVYAQSGLFRGTQTRVLPDRSGEVLLAPDRFPSDLFGTGFTWRAGGRRLVGADWRRASWDPNHQDLAGVFVQDLLALHPRLDLLMGTRLDVWDTGKVRTRFNPRVGALVRAARSLTLRASGYGGFRVPTLNELHRPFQVGNVRTLANPDLSEEYLWGGEAGADFHPSGALLARVNGFWNTLRDPVGNVTLSTSPTAIVRQRQNIGRATIRGLEAELTARRGRHWRTRAAWLLSDTRVRETGLRIPQVPRHQASLSLGWEGPLHVVADGRYVGPQFDDDRNTLRLGGFVVFDASLRRPVGERFELFVSVENLLDRRYAVGRTPLQTLGTPRLAHAGFRFQTSGK
jgi:outer membrane receptor protein involved in Fe transport